MKSELKEMLRLLGGVEAVYEQLNEQILFNLRHKSIERLKSELRDDPPEVLQHVFEIAFDAQQYEICEAIKQIQNKS